MHGEMNSKMHISDYSFDIIHQGYLIYKRPSVLSTSCTVLVERLFLVARGVISHHSSVKMYRVNGLDINFDTANGINGISADFRIFSV